MNGWIAVDLDGTLAHYDGWRGAAHIGEPVPAMLDRVLAWRKAGIDVRIFTARVSDPHPEIRELARATLARWMDEHVGERLPVTNVKDFGMRELWDDRAITVEKNTGRIVKHPHGEPTP